MDLTDTEPVNLDKASLWWILYWLQTKTSNLQSFFINIYFFTTTAIIIHTNISISILKKKILDMHSHIHTAHLLTHSPQYTD